jgi:16S rRNA (adenine(1408)-N(1))-methyltransferase
VLEYLAGKRSLPLAAEDLHRRAEPFPHVLLDLGTGDGRFVRHMAALQPDLLAIGLDACRDPLRAGVRRAPANALYLVANALEPPGELAALNGLVTHLTIHFPWGSLLTGLLREHAELLSLCADVVRPGTRLEVWLNAGALAEVGFDLEVGAARVRQALRHAGFHIGVPEPRDACALRACPTTWAHRLAFGRDPRTLALHGRMARAREGEHRHAIPALAGGL